MAIKLKSILKKRAVKLTAFLLCVVMIVLAGLSAYRLVVTMVEKGYSLESLIVPEYMDSRQFSGELYWRFEEIAGRVDYGMQIDLTAVVFNEFLYDYYITDGTNEMTWQNTGKTISVFSTTIAYTRTGNGDSATRL